MNVGSAGIMPRFLTVWRTYRRAPHDLYADWPVLPDSPSGNGGTPTAAFPPRRLLEYGGADRAVSLVVAAFHCSVCTHPGTVVFVWSLSRGRGRRDRRLKC